MAKKKTTQGDDSAELVTPEEHAKTTDDVVEAAEASPDVDVPELADVSDAAVPDDVEVAARSADMETASDEHRKVFVLGPNPYQRDSNPYVESNGYDHEPNKIATRQYAIDQGMWPTGDARHVSTKRHPDGESWVLTYAVPVIPAHDGVNGAQTPRVVGAAGDTAAEQDNTVLATGATNYAPPAETVDDGDGSTES